MCGPFRLYDSFISKPSCVWVIYSRTTAVKGNHIGLQWFGRVAGRGERGKPGRVEEDKWCGVGSWRCKIISGKQWARSQNFSRWLTLVWLALSSLPLSSCFDISSCGRWEKGEDMIQRIKLSTNTNGRGCTAISQGGSHRHLSSFGNNQGPHFFIILFFG